MKRMFSWFIAVVLITSCHSKSSKEQSDHVQSGSHSQKDSIKLTSTFYNDIARFMAGLLPSDTSQLFPLTRTSEWKSFAEQVNATWHTFQAEKLDIIRTWKKEHIDSLISQTDTVFYPFSGPDFSYMYAFFPHAKTYLMVALEPVGKIPTPNKFRDNLTSFFSALNQAISDNLNLSFFQTKKMKVQLQNELINGTLPILMFFIARHNLIITEIKFFDLDSLGKMVFISADSTSKNRLPHGVQINFYHPQEKIKQTLYYLSFSIRNDGLQAYPEGEKFLRALTNRLTTFVKSSSYCMHFDEYSKIRDIILLKSQYLIQDDSGIPYKFLANNTWKIHFFGKYTKPIPLFENHYQPALENVVTEKATVPFRFGYNKIPFIFVVMKNM